MIPFSDGMKKRGLSAPHQSSYTANVRINAVVCKCFQKFLQNIFIKVNNMYVCS